MRFWLLLITFLNLSVLIQAQSTESYRFVTRGEPVEEVLNRIVDTYSIDLVYDPTMDLSSPVFVDITTDNPSEVLRRVLEGIPLDFIILSSGTYVITEREEIIQRFGKFIGYVLDEETGEPIENASILFADASVSTFTNEQGYFSVSSLNAGNYPVTISSLGYAPQKRTIEVDQTTGVNIIRMSPASYVSEPIVVSGNANSLSNGKLYEEIDLSEFATAGNPAQPSLIRSLNGFSGISFIHSQNELSIQGGDPSNYFISLDGVTLYNTSRAGGFSGMFSPYAIDKVHIQKAAYDASYGGSLSGAIDFTHDLNDRNLNNSLIQTDPNNINLRTEFSTLDSPWSVALTGRFRQFGQHTPYGLSGTLNEWNRLDPLIQNFLMGSDNDIAHYHAAIQDNGMNHNDLHAIVKYSADEYSKTTISGYFGNQKLQTYLLSERATLSSAQPDYVYSQENTEAYNAMGQVSHYRILSPQTDISAQLSYSTNSYSNIYFMDSYSQTGMQQISRDEIYQYFRSSYTPNERLSNSDRVRDLSFSTELTQYFSSLNKSRFGLELKYLDYDFELNDLFYFPTDNDSRFALITAYASNKLTVNRNFWLEVGLRSSYSTNDQNLYLLPRISATYDSEKTFMGYHTVNLRAGVYRQFFNQFDIANIGPSAMTPFNRFSAPVDESIDAPVSYQSAVSWSVTPTERIRFSLEGYFKNEPRSYEIHYDNILTGSGTSTGEFMDQSQFLTDNQIQSYGGALSIDTYLRSPELHLKLIAQSNVSRQKITGRFNDSWNHTAWSEPFSASFFADWKLSKNLTLISNLRWTPTRYWAFNRAYYDFMTTHNETMIGRFDLNDPDSQSLDDFFRMDLGANLTFPFKSFTLKSRIDLINVTNRKNEMSYYLTPLISNAMVRYQKDKRILPGFTPSFSVQLEF